uniref:Uncharacterized protein n=1 Tax=Anguilla anguilla TaxID=7936 RepID=A0A0E9X5M7_ANGAN
MVSSHAGCLESRHFCLFHRQYVSMSHITKALRSQRMFKRNNGRVYTGCPICSALYTGILYIYCEL